MGNHTSRLRGVLDAFILLAIIGPTGAALAATASLNSSLSSWNLLHHPGSGSSPGASVTFTPGIAIQSTSTPSITYNSLKTFKTSPSAGTTRGKAGVGRTQSSTVAKLVFPAGIGVDQTDPPSATQSSSAVRIEFHAVFDIVGAGSFGPTINSIFSVPFGATIAPGGTAQFDAHIEWFKKIGVTTSAARTPY